MSDEQMTAPMPRVFVRRSILDETPIELDQHAIFSVETEAGRIDVTVELHRGAKPRIAINRVGIRAMQMAVFPIVSNQVEIEV